jgi:hypothetical protein
MVKLSLRAVVLRKRPIATGDPDRGWHDLLAHRGQHSCESQNDKLLPYAEKMVTASGKVFDRGGSKA